MKERPILFSAPMVRAILEGRKTQTRRMFKVQPMSCVTDICLIQDKWHFKLQGCKNFARYNDSVKCPQGKIGDQLWVREAWHTDEPDLKEARSMHEDVYSTSPIYYRADPENDCGGCRWRPSIHMPRWASRIQLEITGVRAERLNDISNEDAIAEGVGAHWICSDSMPHNPHLNHNPLSRFIDLWKSINSYDSWNKNPWVWVIEFKRIR